MSEHRFRLKHGAFEFEVAGDRDFVESQAKDLVARLGDAFWRRLDMAPPVPEAPPVEEDDLPAHLSEDAIPRVPDTFRPKVNVTLEEFVTMKEARSPMDLLVVAGYYMEKYLRRERYAVSDLNSQLEGLAAAACLDVDALMEEALVAGFFDPLRDGAYTLTYKGQTYVRNGLVLD